MRPVTKELLFSGNIRLIRRYLQKGNAFNEILRHSDSQLQTIIVSNIKLFPEI